jgi:hypothetical protein
MKLQSKLIEIDWSKFKPYSSFFIPCLDVQSMKQQVRKECKRMKFRVLIKVVTENQIRGIRVWRLLDID